jgi:hypothetical protein
MPSPFLHASLHALLFAHYTLAWGRYLRRAKDDDSVYKTLSPQFLLCLYSKSLDFSSLPQSSSHNWPHLNYCPWPHRKHSCTCCQSIFASFWPNLAILKPMLHHSTSAMAKVNKDRSTSLCRHIDLCNIFLSKNGVHGITVIAVLTMDGGLLQSSFLLKRSTFSASSSSPFDLMHGEQRRLLFPASKNIHSD